MRASIVISTYNEGECLWKTVRSCVDSIAELDYEIVVADDASDDGSVDEMQRRFPEVRLVRHPRRLGAPPTKDLGARHARGDVLVFLDGHCNPDPSAIERLVADVEQLPAPAVVAPRIALLDARNWANSTANCSNGYLMDLETLEESWPALPELRRRGRFIESPNLVGCCLAVKRQLYHQMGGYDVDMLGWGGEHVDLGLKVWLLGYRVLNDIEVVVGHRYKDEEEGDVPEEQTLANKLRLARKHFSEPVWEDWLRRFRPRQREGLWQAAWAIFGRRRESVERQREDLMARRVHDEFWYADQFGLNWPSCLAQRPSCEQWLAAQNGHRLPPLNDPDALGTARLLDGTWLTVLLKIGRRLWGDFDIHQVGFQCEGPSEVRACAEVLARMIQGRTIWNANRLRPDSLTRRFAPGAAVPRAADLAIDALQRAIGGIPETRDWAGPRGAIEQRTQ